MKLWGLWTGILGNNFHAFRDYLFSGFFMCKYSIKSLDVHGCFFILQDTFSQSDTNFLDAIDLMSSAQFSKG